MVMCAFFGGGGEIMMETPQTLYQDDKGDGGRMKTRNGNLTICADGIHIYHMSIFRINHSVSPKAESVAEQNCNINHLPYTLYMWFEI